VWWKAPEPPKRQTTINDIIDSSLPFDKDNVLRLISPRHKQMLMAFDDVAVTGYRRVRNHQQFLELRFDGVAGCLRTPQGGSSKQFLVVKHGDEIHARALSPREAARLMGAPDTFKLPGTPNDGYKAMGDAVAAPVARFVGSAFLIKLAETIYGKEQNSKAA
jgi:DNA (cytosine-5)-methyltransferase 1